MTYTVKVDPYYDAFDFDIDDDPYPVGKHLRDSAPLYYPVALEEVLSRWPGWEVDHGRAKRAHTTSVRGWATLPVSVD